MERALAEILDRLDNILTPPTSYTNGTILFFPNKEDLGPVADLKREIYEKCAAVVETGRAWLSNKSFFGARHLTSAAYDQIDSVLSGDPEQRAYFEAIHLAQSAENLLHEGAA